MKDPAHLKFMNTLRCIVCGKEYPDAAHCREGLFAMGMKPSDRLVLPLCRTCHTEQHSMNEGEYWDPILKPKQIIAATGVWSISHVRFGASPAEAVEMFIERIRA